MSDKVRAERWEGDEFVIVVDGLGAVGQTCSRRDADVIARWLRTALRELAASPHELSEEGS